MRRHQRHHRHHRHHRRHDQQQRDRCVVIGAGIGGLAVARAAADHFERVTVLDRDALPADGQDRRGVPQGRHAHALLVAGSQALERLFPGFVEDAVVAGAVVGAPPPFWGMPYGDTPARSLYASRPLLEEVLRRRVQALDRVTVRAGVGADGLLWDASGERVTGVHVRSGDGADALPADLVIDCTGRVGRTLGWLAERGHRLPELSSVHVDMGYGTVCVERRPGDLGGATSLLSLAPPPLSRGAAVLPVEHGRWIVTAAGAHGDHPPTEWGAFVDYVRTIPPNGVTELLLRSAPQPVRTYRFAGSQRRHVERWRPVPGHLLAGDALCSFNPIYGQGMSVVAQEAEALDDVLAHRRDLAGAAAAFYRRAARIVESPWIVAACRDFGLDATTGDKPRGTDRRNAYLGRFAVAATQDPALAHQLMLVQNLVAAPGSLLRPDRALRTWQLTRRLQLGGAAPDLALADR